MRLNCIELFYIFLLRFRTKHNEDGRSRSSAGAIDNGQALYRGDQPWPGPYRGGQLWPRPLIRVATRRGNRLQGRLGHPCPRQPLVGAASSQHDERGGDSGTHDAMAGDHDTW
ncbi:hypothetical protein GW17_00046368 [Ensete ventricosum]|nr:hypothetical protein GW17_00046368 [Ensete ventricosum]RZR88323.1 hypothetical protein BHM03_00015875 [Ensete ventricosum]